jgi:hypothetical protein
MFGFPAGVPHMTRAALKTLRDAKPGLAARIQHAKLSVFRCATEAASLLEATQAAAGGGVGGGARDEEQHGEDGFHC